jgi:hypothetical protein
MSGLPSPERVALLTGEANSLLAKLAEDYAWAHSVACCPTRRAVAGRGSGHTDPTGNTVADPARLAVSAHAAAAARLLELAVRDLRAADAEIGEALLAAEPPGPFDHTKAAWHDTGGLRYPDPAVYTAQLQRRTRGEGIPT